MASQDDEHKGAPVDEGAGNDGGEKEPTEAPVDETAEVSAPVDAPVAAPIDETAEVSAAVDENAEVSAPVDASVDESAEVGTAGEVAGGDEITEAPVATGFREWLQGARLSDRWHVALGLVLPMVVLLANMVRLRSFTIDDAYISYRYARNLARGLGLVYNEGERIEGYTNFLWTVLLAAGIKLGIDPEVVAKGLGGLSACGALAALFILARRFRPLGTVPVLATWLFASSIVQSGYAVFGLETAFFIFLVLAGTEMLYRERDRAALAHADPALPWSSMGGFPWSGLVFGLAGLTRPEAPLYIGIPMLFLGLRGFFRSQNLLRGVLFAAPIAAHMLWRHSYYGTWLTNTAAAKTGSLKDQIAGGTHYLAQYAQHAWPALALALFGLCLAIMMKHRDALCAAALALLVGAYVLVVGGDWMPYFRFMGTFEPYCFLLAGLAAQRLLEALHTFAAERVAGRMRGAVPFAVAGGVVAVAAIVGVGVQRSWQLNKAQRSFLTDHKVFWDSAAGGAAAWLKEHNVPGEVALGDIGYVGYATDYPVLDLLGLVDPVISGLPGGYTRKTGPGYVERVFDKMPRYFVFVGGVDTCDKLPFPSQDKLRKDRRFRAKYKVSGKVKHSKGGLWCIFERDDNAAPAAEPAGTRKRIEKPRP